MTRAKPPYVPAPRALAAYQVAARINRGVEWFKAHRPELEAEGFPEYDELLGGWDGKAIEVWFDHRSGLAPGTNNDDAALDRRIREFGDG